MNHAESLLAIIKHNLVTLFVTLGEGSTWSQAFYCWRFCCAWLSWDVEPFGVAQRDSGWQAVALAVVQSHGVAGGVTDDQKLDWGTDGNLWHGKLFQGSRISGVTKELG